MRQRSAADIAFRARLTPEQLARGRAAELERCRCASLGPIVIPAGVFTEKELSRLRRGGLYRWARLRIELLKAHVCCLDDLLEDWGRVIGQVRRRVLKAVPPPDSRDNGVERLESQDRMPGS